MADLIRTLSRFVVSVMPMPIDPYAKTRLLARRQSDEYMRRDEPWLWHFANTVTWAIHPWMSLRLWWLGRSMR